MTKDEILAAAGFDNTPEGVAAFYKKFKSKEDFDNYMASGGSSNRVPTAKEFFNFGATTNLNIPFGNFAYGGTNMKDGGPKLSKKKKALVDKAIQDSYNKMVNGKATDQFDELHYDAGLSNDMTRKFMVDTKGPSGASNDPGTYARNINKFLGRDVIPFPVNQSRMMEEDWNNSYQPVAPPIMYYNDDPAMASYPYINYDTLTPPSPQEPEVYAFGGVPCMDCGGYMQDGGFMDMLNSVSKEYKKHITKDTVIQGGNDLNPGQKMTMQFKNKLAQNFQTASIDEIHNEFKQMGGANYSTGIDYQNQAFQNMYQTKINQGKSNLKNDVTDLFQGITAMNAPENQFNKTTITQAQYGMPIGPNFKGGLSPQQLAMLEMSDSFVPDNARTTKKDSTTVVGSGQNPLPATYANYYLQEYSNKHFGPWGKTRMTFGTGAPGTSGYNQSSPENPYSDHKYNPFQPATEDAGANSSESWFSRWRAARQGKAEDRARAKKYNHRPEESQTGMNGAIYDYEKDMPTDYNPKKMANWDWYNPDAPEEKEFGGPMYQFGAQVQYDAQGNPIDPNKQMMKQKTFGSTSTDDMFGTNNIFNGDNQRNNFGTPKPQQNNQEAQGNSSFTIQNKYGPSLTGPAAASTLLAGVNTLASGIENSQDKSKEKLAELTLADNAFVKNPLNNQSRGDYDQWGNLRVDQYVPVQFYGQFGGENNLPIAREGLDLRAGLYGTKGNRQFSLPNRVQSTKFSEPLTDVRGTLQPVDRADANVEAEKKEQVVINIDNLPTNFKIGGERHSNGGTPLNLPDDSFIFSDTPKMVIKDPIILAQFGMIPKKSGYTPAEIAKKYDINKFRQVLANKDAEDLEKKTAEMMIANYNMKLAKLALLQESMKGFPQGIPKMAIPYVEANEINPQDLIGGPNQSGPQQMDPNMISTEQGQSDEPDADMGVSRFGGLVKAQDGRAVTKGFGAPLIRKSEGEFAAKYPAIYNAYMTALNNKDVAEMNKVASLIESQQKTQTPWYSLDMIPGSDADMFENLSSVLKEEAAKINGNSSYKPEVIKSKYQDLPVKALGIYGKLKEEYAAIPKDDYMKLIEKDNQIKKIESYLPQNKARFLPESVKEPWQLYNKEDLTMINALFNQTFKQTSGEVKVNKAKVDNTTKPVETKPVKTATQAEQQPANIEIKTKPAKAAKPNKTSVDTFYVDDLSAEEKALLGLK